MSGASLRGPWRDPPEESTDLYPGLCVSDNRMTGSITFGQLRTPLWAPVLSFEDADDYLPPEYVPDWEARVEAAEAFVRNLMQMRGEFGRLLLVLANAERMEQRRRSFTAPAWWETKKHRKIVAAQLRRCLEALGES